MASLDDRAPLHPSLTLRFGLQAGAVSLLSLGMNHLAALRAAAAEGAPREPRARAAIFDLSLRRPGPARQLRHEAGRARGDSRRVSSHSHRHLGAACGVAR
jgi:hypothetical protein